MTTRTPASDRRRPVAYLTMQDTAARAAIARTLTRAGWTVIAKPTGFHLIQEIAGVIEGDHPWSRPDLIVIDAHARGCAGTTLAAGLRDLGITIPIVLVAPPGETLPVSADHALFVTDGASAARVVDRLAARAAPLASTSPRPGLGWSRAGPCRDAR